MIKTKKLYRIYDDELWDKKKIDFLNSIWCTNGFECRNMSMKDAHNISTSNKYKL